MAGLFLCCCVCQPERQEVGIVQNPPFLLFAYLEPTKTRTRWLQSQKRQVGGATYIFTFSSYIASYPSYIRGRCMRK